ncbi:hypothetical protein [Virgibacillus halodenitrificans]|uniref:hypothetical protein n=1 Tax=Virgibacillus halodenitrificans TaxID=1482 RepID=UPI000306CFF2|nr:hypothetical protein [Virgibacillus halodenitrificans]
MQKNYRDYTVGELLDLGFEVEAIKHRIKNKEDANKEVSQFEGVKVSSRYLDNGVEFVRGWKEKFKAIIFIN